MSTTDDPRPNGDVPPTGAQTPYGSPPPYAGQYQPGQHQQPGPYQQPGTFGAPQGQAMSPDSERTWAIAAHLSSFAAAYVALGFLGPLICMLVVGDRSPYARRQAVEALNFNLSWLIYIAVSALLIFVFIGFFLLAGLGIAYLILVIMGAVAASKGEEFRYPLTLRMVS